ncbi:hypothetical protein [Rhodococcus qingshengii]|uniref:hypothetical protein n=1 Tax=Rhodococcus qingshengii TaxID=334542 RepID=UPI0035DB8370
MTHETLAEELEGDCILPLMHDGTCRPAPAKPSEPCSHGVCSANNGHGGTCAEASGWAEPAEEETKAEESAVTVCDETQKAYDEAVSLSYWLAQQLGEHVDDACDRGETLTDTVQRLIEHIRPNLGKTKTASSPVVPAPTETGPWPSLLAVPVTVQKVKDAKGYEWHRRGSTDGWRGCNGADAYTSNCRTGHRDSAPFVAAEEG